MRGGLTALKAQPCTARSSALLSCCHSVFRDRVTNGDVMVSVQVKLTLRISSSPAVGKPPGLLHPPSGQR